MLRQCVRSDHLSQKWDNRPRKSPSGGDHLLHIDVNVGSVQRCRLDFSRAQLHDTGNTAAARSRGLDVTSCNTSAVVRNQHAGREVRARQRACRGPSGLGTLPNLPMAGISATGADAFLMPHSGATSLSHTEWTAWPHVVHLRARRASRERLVAPYDATRPGRCERYTCCLNRPTLT